MALSNRIISLFVSAAMVWNNVGTPISEGYRNLAAQEAPALAADELATDAQDSQDISLSDDASGAPDGMAAEAGAIEGQAPVSQDMSVAAQEDSGSDNGADETVPEASDDAGATLDDAATEGNAVPGAIDNPTAEDSALEASDSPGRGEDSVSASADGREGDVAIGAADTPGQADESAADPTAAAPDLPAASPSEAPTAAPDQTAAAPDQAAEAPTDAVPAESIEQGAALAQEREVQATLNLAEGGSYRVTVAFDESAGIPADASLLLREYSQVPEHYGDPDPKYVEQFRNRPTPTESFLSKEDMASRMDLVAQGLALEEGLDRIYGAKLIHAYMVDSKGQTISIDSSLRVTIETDAIDIVDAPAVEVGYFDPDYDAARMRPEEAVIPLAVTNLTENKTREDFDRDPEHPLRTRLEFGTERLGTFAVTCVARAKHVWEQENARVVLQAAGSSEVTAEAWGDASQVGELGDGVEPLGGWWVRFAEEPAYGARAWLTTSDIEGAAVRPEGTGYAAWRLNDPASRLFGAAGTTTPVALGPGDVIALGWDTGTRTDEAVAPAKDDTTAAPTVQDEPTSPTDTASGKESTGNDEPSDTEGAKDDKPTTPTVQDEPTSTTDATQDKEAAGDDKASDAEGTKDDKPTAPTAQDKPTSTSDTASGKEATGKDETPDAEATAKDDTAAVPSAEDQTTSATDATTGAATDQVATVAEEAPDAEAAQDAAALTVPALPLEDEGPTSQVPAPDPQAPAPDPQAPAPDPQAPTTADDPRAAEADPWPTPTVPEPEQLEAFVSFERKFVASDGHSYNVTAGFDAPSGLPAGAKLSVREIVAGSREYLDYVSAAAGELNVDHQSISFARAFDIAFVDPVTGREVEPTAPAKVRIELLSEDLSGSEDTGVVHFGDTPEVIEATQTGDAVAFEAGSFSVYVVCGYTVESYYRDSAGDTWRITATYGPEAGLPADVELVVRELTEDEAGGYLSATAEALGKDEEDVRIAKAFDIAFKKGDTSYHKLDGDVAISIELLDQDPSDALEVVHFGDVTEKLESVTEGTSVSFSSDEFSVYVIGDDVKRRTYSFLQYQDGAWVPYEFDLTDSQGNRFTTNKQVLKNGDTLALPVLEDSESGETFVGWYRNPTTDANTLGAETAGVKNDIERDEYVTLYARFGTLKFITFYAFPSSSAKNYVFNTMRVVIPGGASNATVDLTTQPEAVSADELDEFNGWSTVDGTPVANPTSYSVSEDISLYPTFKKVYWISFVSEVGSGATYIPARQVDQGTTISGAITDTVPTRPGYTFDGWFVGDARVTNASNEIVHQATSLSGGSISAEGVLTLTNNITLTSHWTNGTTSFRVVYWKELVSDQAKLAWDAAKNAYAAPEAEKEYEYACTQTASATSGTTLNWADLSAYRGRKNTSINIDGTAYSFLGFNFNSMKDASGNVLTDSSCNVTVAGDGSTYINVYYDREVMTYTFDFPPDDTTNQTDYPTIAWNQPNPTVGVSAQTEYENGHTSANNPYATVSQVTKVVRADYPDDFTVTGLYGAPFSGGITSTEAPAVWPGQYEIGGRFTVTAQKYFVNRSGRGTTLNPYSYSWTYSSSTTTGYSPDYSTSYSTYWYYAKNTLTDLVTAFTYFRDSSGELNSPDYSPTVKFTPYVTAASTNTAGGTVYFYQEDENGNYPTTSVYSFFLLNQINYTVGGGKYVGYEFDRAERYTSGSNNPINVNEGDVYSYDQFTRMNIYLKRKIRNIEFYDGSTKLDSATLQRKYDTPLTDLAGTTMPVPTRSASPGTSFAGWFLDNDHTIYVSYRELTTDEKNELKAKYYQIKDFVCLSDLRMPNRDIALYAGWLDDEYVIRIDPNHGELKDGESTFFWLKYGDRIAEYRPTRMYEPAAAGTTTGLYYYHTHTYDDYLTDGDSSDRTARYVDTTGDQNVTIGGATVTLSGEYTDTSRAYVKMDTTPYTFYGWYRGNMPYNFDSGVEGDVTLTARWSRRGQFTIQYDQGDHGQIDPSITVDDKVYLDQANVHLKGGVTADPGYFFAGWSVRNPADNNLLPEVHAAGQTFRLDADYAFIDENHDNTDPDETKGHILLVAQYKKLASSYIEYDANGGSYVGSAPDVSALRMSYGENAVYAPSGTSGYAITGIEQNITLKTDNGENFTYAGHKIIGWAYAESDADNGVVDVSLGGLHAVSDQAGSGHTLYAVWKESADVRFVLNGGAWTEASEEYKPSGADYVYVAEKGETLALPSNPTKGGSAFKGWSKTNGGNPITALETVNADLTLYAIWEESKVSIRFDLGADDATWGAGLPIMGKGLYVDTTPVGEYTLPSLAPTRPGYTFYRWTYLGARYRAGSSFYAENRDDILFTAVWSRSTSGKAVGVKTNDSVVELGTDIPIGANVDGGEPEVAQTYPGYQYVFTVYAGAIEQKIDILENANRVVSLTDNGNGTFTARLANNTTVLHTESSTRTFYSVYVQDRSVSVSLKMVNGTDNLTLTNEMPKAGTAYKATLPIGSVNLADELPNPLTYTNTTYKSFTYGIGHMGATSLTQIDTKNQGALYIRQTWNGFAYSMNGEEWTDVAREPGGEYDVEIYILYDNRAETLTTVQQLVKGFQRDKDKLYSYDVEIRGRLGFNGKSRIKDGDTFFLRPASNSEETMNSFSSVLGDGQSVVVPLHITNNVGTTSVTANAYYYDMSSENRDKQYIGPNSNSQQEQLWQEAKFTRTTALDPGMTAKVEMHTGSAFNAFDTQNNTWLKQLGISMATHFDYTHKFVYERISYDIPVRFVEMLEDGSYADHPEWGSGTFTVEKAQEKTADAALANSLKTAALDTTEYTLGAVVYASGFNRLPTANELRSFGSTLPLQIKATSGDQTLYHVYTGNTAIPDDAEVVFVYYRNKIEVPVTYVIKDDAGRYSPVNVRSYGIDDLSIEADATPVSVRGNAGIVAANESINALDALYVVGNVIIANAQGDVLRTYRSNQSVSLVRTAAGVSDNDSPAVPQMQVWVEVAANRPLHIRGRVYTPDDYDVPTSVSINTVEYLPKDGTQRVAVSDTPVAVDWTYKGFEYLRYSESFSRQDAYESATIRNSTVEKLDGTEVTGLVYKLGADGYRHWYYQTEDSANPVQLSNSTVLYANYILPLYICKIEDANPRRGKKAAGRDVYEHGFATLKAAVEYARANLNGTATIQMLVDYEIPSDDKVTLDQANDSITITTAPTSGGVYNFAPTFTAAQGRQATDTGTAILARGWGDTSGDSFLFKTTGANAKLTTTNIIFDGTQANTTKYSGRLMYIDKGSLEIKGGTTVRNFKQEGANSGAIYTNARPVTLTANSGETILFDSCVTGGEGGAIRPAGGSVTINNQGTIRFHACSSGTAGGAISTNSGNSSYSVTVTNSGTLAFENCTCSSSSNGGGAIWTGAFTVTNAGTGTIDFETCTASGGKGGAIGAIAALTITNNGTGDIRFSGCSARSDGGGIYATGNASITGAGKTVFTKCSATDGGGICQTGGSSITLTNVIFGAAGVSTDGCTATSEGGAIYTSKAGTLTDCSFYYCRATSSTSGGGAILYNGGAQVLNGCLFDHCEVSGSGTGNGNGGAIRYFNGNEIVIDKSDLRRSSFSNCTANRYGGAIEYEPDNSGKLEVRNADFTNCISSTTYGGAIASDAATLKVSDCTFTGCKAENGNGGAVAVGLDHGSGTAEVENASISDCKAKSGAAVYFNGNGTIKQSGTGASSINGCAASNATGGAVNLAFGKTVSFEGDVVIYGNTGTGTLAAQQKNLVLDESSSTKIKTTAAGLGGSAHIGVYVTGTMTGTQTNPYKDYGQFEQDFGTHGTSTAHFETFTNDRNGLYGEVSTNAGKIRWQSYLCKLTDASGNLLYTTAAVTLVGTRTVTIDEAKTTLYPAVYNYLTTQDDADAKTSGGFSAAAGALYTSAGVAVADDAAVQVQMLKNYTQPSTDAVTVGSGRPVTLTTAKTVMTENPAYATGDVYVYCEGSAEEKRATITRGFGGESMFTTTGTLTMANIIFDGNGTTYAKANGGQNDSQAKAMITAKGSGSLTLNTGTALQNAKLGLGNYNGAAVYLAESATVTMNDGSVIHDCTAREGSAIYQQNGTFAMNSGALIERCDGNFWGGAIRMNGGTANIAGGEIRDCHAGVGQADGQGGAVLVNGGTLNFSGGTISACYASAKGGGISRNNGNVNLSGTAQITGCIAKQGGGISGNGGVTIATTTERPAITSCQAKTVTITNNGAMTVADVFAETSLGGGVYADGGVTLTSGIVSGNSAYYGGGMYVANGTPTIKGGSIAQNTALFGGGVYVGKGAFSMRGGSITANTGTEAGGGIAFSSEGTAKAVFQHENNASMVVRDNLMGSSSDPSAQITCNVYLDQDLTTKIESKGMGTSGDSYIGVYVEGSEDDDESLYNKRGVSGTAFGNYTDGTTPSAGGDHLNAFVNDRDPILYGTRKAILADRLIYWADFVCKITDANGNLLYRDQARTLPAVYDIIGSGVPDKTEADHDRSSAFGTLSYDDPALYGAGDEDLADEYDETGKYVGTEYRVEMLVEDYTTTRWILAPAGKTITFTTASSDEGIDYPYRGTPGTYATITRGPDTVKSSMITAKGDLKLSMITLDGGATFENGTFGGLACSQSGSIVALMDSGKVWLQSGATLQGSYNAYTGNEAERRGGGAIANRWKGGDANEIHIESGSVIQDCGASGYGGAIAMSKGKLYMSGGTITNCHAFVNQNDAKSGRGGAIHIWSASPNANPVEFTLTGGTISNCTAVTAGGAISIETPNSRIKLSGNPSFSNNYVVKSGYATKENGGEPAYAEDKVRQDIHFPAVSGNASFIRVTGSITSDPGSIWVWADSDNAASWQHYKDAQQFAILAGEAANLAASGEEVTGLTAFRNAQDDEATANEHGAYLTGVLKDDDAVNVYWGVEIKGYRKVILRKVDDAAHETLDGATFELYRGDKNEVYVLKDRASGEQVTMGTATLRSEANGVIWVGELPYGTYYLKEVTAPTGPAGASTNPYEGNANQWFCLIVDEDGARMSSGFSAATAAAAKAAALADLQPATP